MKKLVRLQPLFLTFMMIFFSCDNNVTISKNLTHFDPTVNITKLDPNEKLPAGVREFLSLQPVSTKARTKFPLCYYLIPEGDAKLLKTKNFNPKIVAQLLMSISGAKYHKLFVHPDSDAAYAFLKSAYRYIGPDLTEFVATPIEGKQNLIVWSDNALEREAFIVKTVLDNETLQAITSRLPANSTPEIASLVFKRKIKGSSKEIEGQQIIDIP